MVNDPFDDKTRENKGVLPRGRYVFIPVAIRIGGKLVDPDAFTYANVARIEDPDGADITATWVTKALDPNDPSDTYDDNHATYKGDDAGVDANIGLFSDGSGHVALKVNVPIGAEETRDNPNREYKIFWDIRVGGATITDADGELFETFNVGPPGTLVFDSNVVEVDQVKRGISTSLSDTDIEGLIEEAACWAEGVLEACGIDTTKFETLPSLVKTGIVLYTRSLILDYDASAGTRFESMKEGSRSVKFATQSTRDIDTFRKRAMEAIDLYCRNNSSKRRVRLDVSRQKTTSKPFGAGRVVDMRVPIFE